MRVAFTAMKAGVALGVCDLKTGDVDLVPAPPTADHRPFGITWDDRDLYLAQSDQVLAFDRQLNFKAVVLDRMWPNNHQALCRDGKLWVVSPTINGLVQHDLASGRTSYFFPDRGVTLNYLPVKFLGKDRTYSDDTSHYNSVFIGGGRLYVAAHNFGPGFIKVFSYPGLEFQECHSPVGNKIHNLLVGEEVVTLDSQGSQSLITAKGQHLVRIGGSDQFLRGLAATRDHAVTACFRHSPSRLGRRAGDAELVVVERETWKVVSRVAIIGLGNVNDIRLLDQFDECHGLPPFIT